MSGAKVKGGSVEVKGKRTEDDYLTLRFGRDVTIEATELDRSAKELATLLAAEQPVVTLQLSSVAFPSGRDLMAFCDDMALDFDRVEWKQE